MVKLYKWQQAFIDTVNKYSDEEIFEYIINLSEAFERLDTRDYYKLDYLRSEFYKRMGW